MNVCGKNPFKAKNLRLDLRCATRGINWLSLMFIYSNVCFGSRLFLRMCCVMDLKRVKTVRISTSLLRWDANRGKRWWKFLTFFQITQAQWFTSWVCLVTEWATGPQIGSPGGAGVFRIIAWAWGGFYLSIRWYWGWTLKSDKLLKIADMHSILFGRSWHIWLWSWHKGSSAEAPPPQLHLPPQLIAIYFSPLPSRRKKMLSVLSHFWVGGRASSMCCSQMSHIEHSSMFFSALWAVGFNWELGRWMQHRDTAAHFKGSPNLAAVNKADKKDKCSCIGPYTND